MDDDKAGVTRWYRRNRDRCDIPANTHPRGSSSAWPRVRIRTGRPQSGVVGAMRVAIQASRWSRGVRSPWALVLSWIYRGSVVDLWSGTPRTPESALIMGRSPHSSASRRCVAGSAPWST